MGDERVMDEDVVRAAEAFARGEVEYDETARVELPPAADTEPMVIRGVRLPESPPPPSMCRPQCPE
ncbi:hypothetical protein [Micromonospora sp. NPDC005206]|uniref:hypothetical protein n=1 Tax=Micromonospora sp. NPDC005206 TaxID=3157022 RepID=UPI0033B18D0D